MGKKYRLLSVQESRDRLVESGEEVLKSERDLVVLGSHTYDHNGRRRKVWADKIILDYPGHRVYAEQGLRPPLAYSGIETQELKGALEVIHDVYGANKLVLGISGYTGTGMSYAGEAKLLELLFRGFKAVGHVPALVTDGGVSSGVLGLGAVKARSHQVSTLGYVPRQGLHAVGPRDHIVVAMDTYEAREQLVGATPDILVCVGGEDGTIREAEASLRLGGVVAFLAPAGYQTWTARSLAAESGPIIEGRRQGRVSFCKGTGALNDTIVGAINAAHRYSLPRRADRFVRLRRLLSE